MKQLEKGIFCPPTELSLDYIDFCSPVDDSELSQNKWPIEKNVVFRGRGVIKGKRAWPHRVGGAA